MDWRSATMCRKTQWPLQKNWTICCTAPNCALRICSFTLQILVISLHVTNGMRCSTYTLDLSNPRLDLFSVGQKIPFCSTTSSNLHLHIGMKTVFDLNRVTRLGEFFLLKKWCINFDVQKNVLSYILGNFLQTHLVTLDPNKGTCNSPS
jgi:hypothetical protein